jgi:hypothetical protein
LKTLCKRECSTTQTTNCCSNDGTEAVTFLDTVLGEVSLEGIEAVLAPPAGWFGVPTFVAENLLGVGIKFAIPSSVCRSRSKASLLRTRAQACSSPSRRA